MGKCTDAVTNWMIRCHVIHEEDKELYKYAIHSFFLLLSPLILAGGIGFCVGSVKHGFAVILPFIVLRKFSGGYHAKNLHTCILGSGFLLLLCIICSIHVQCDWRLAITTAIASVSLIVFSPMDSENRRIDRDERRSYKKNDSVLCDRFWSIRYNFIFVRKVHLYKLFFYWNIIDSRSASALYCKKGEIDQKRTVSVVWCKWD